MPNDYDSPGPGQFSSIPAPDDADIPPFLHERGFAGILAAAASALRAGIASSLEMVGLPPWGPGRVGLMSKLLDEPMSQVDVANFMRISPPSAMELVRRLERDGYVRRTRDPKDQRRRLVSLTEGARRQVIEMRRSLVAGMTAVEERMAAEGFSDADLERCKALLRAYTEVSRAEHVRRQAPPESGAAAG